MTFNPNETPLRGDKSFAARVDVQNSNTIFLIRRIRGFKTLKDLDKYQGEYYEVWNALDTLISEISAHPRALLLEMRRLLRRVKYLKNFLQAEFAQKIKTIQRDDEVAAYARRAAALNKPNLRINAQALAAFIVK